MKFILLLILFTVNSFATTIINPPFNFQPVNTVVGTTASYTVPAGKYAIVKINASASARILSASGASLLSGNNFAAVSNSAASESQEFILKAGDVLTSTLSNASGSVTNSPSATAGAGSETVVTVSVNGTSALVVRAVVSAVVGKGDTSTINFTGSSSVGYVASEYNNIQ